MTSSTSIPVAFDPKSPSCLLLLTPSSSSSPSSQNFTSLFADDGVGSTSEETRCLMRLIDTRNDHHSLVQQQQNQQYIGGSREMDMKMEMSYKTLSVAYRNEIVECIQTWGERIDNSIVNDEHEHENGQGREHENSEKTEQEYKDYELLKLTHAILQLSEIYLCTPQKKSKQIHDEDDDDNDQFMSLYDHHPTQAQVQQQKQQQQKGLVTADTIRYLRYHHLPNVEDYIQQFLISDNDDEEEEEITVEELLEMNQPEHWNPRSPSSSSSSSSSSTNMTPYWILVRKLMLRGLFQDAWNVLSRHSAFTRASKRYTSGSASTGTGTGFTNAITEEDMEAFSLIEEILLFAPIPGGRDTLKDDGLNFMNQNDIEVSENEDDWWNGIPLSAYKLWDRYQLPQQSSPSNSHNNVQSLSTTLSTTTGKVVDAPIQFNIYAIMNLYSSWKMAVSQYLRSNTSLRNLTRRIPNLRSCVFDIILNTESVFLPNEDTWSERLIAELLYVRPNIPQEDISVRALAHMKSCGAFGDGKQLMEDIVLEVMKGNAGAVVEALHSFGGASGAALPATMTALLCNLLVENGQIQLSDLSYDIQTEKLLAASSAILSSFAMQNHNDVGIRLSTKLLQPFIRPENMQVTSHVAEMISTHWPKSDAEVKGLLSICLDAVKRGSLRMEDACESLTFSRALFYFRQNKFELYAFWLLRGVECSVQIGVEGRENASLRTKNVVRSMCFRQFTKLCADMTLDVLKKLVEYSSLDDEIDASVLLQRMKQAKILQGIIVEDDISELVVLDPSVSLFLYVADIAWHSLLERDDLKVAAKIVSCLEKRVDLDGSVLIPAYPGLYGYFLSLAFDILSTDDKNIGDIDSESSVSFDVHGIQVLFCCFDRYCNYEKYGYDVNATSVESWSSLRHQITPHDMRTALGKGLMRAFVAQNANIGTQKSSSIVAKGSYADSSVNLDQLLGPSMQ